MNDLYYIFYDARRMYLDTVGMSKEGKVAHRQLCDYIWFNDGPPSSDNEQLRQIASCAESDWGRVKRELLGKGWVESPKFFLHRGAIKSLNESKVRYVENFNRTCKANGLPPLVFAPPDPDTGVTGYVASRVTSDVTASVTGAQSDQDQEPDGKQGKVIRLTIEAAPGGVGGGAKAPNSKLQAPSLESGAVLTRAALGRVVNELLANKWGWHWDNCKVPRQAFHQGALVTEFTGLVDRVSEGAVQSCWCEAVKATHQAMVDGLTVKTPAGYTIACFRELIEKERNA